MGLLKGIDVTLYEKVQAGVDDFNAPIYKEEPTVVSNVLVTPEADTDVVEDVRLYGKKAEYELSIPKGDAHIWADRTVEFFGSKWHTFGMTREYVEDLVPLEWNKKVKVERYG